MGARIGVGAVRGLTRHAAEHEIAVLLAAAKQPVAAKSVVGNADAGLQVLVAGIPGAVHVVVADGRISGIAQEVYAKLLAVAENPVVAVRVLVAACLEDKGGGRGQGKVEVSGMNTL
jgi:hypothetical protein